MTTVAAFSLAPPAAAAGAGRAGGAAVATAERPSAGAADRFDIFLGVSCASSAACVAVGERGKADGLPLAERWNGRRWVIQATRGTGWFRAVSCPSRTACTAIGGSYGAEAWNGKTWVGQRVRSDNLVAVSCSSRIACTAVGYVYAGSPGFGETPLAYRWNGRRWARQATPRLVDPQGFSTGRFLGVSCSSRVACVAVGDYLVTSPGASPSDSTVALAEAWDGRTWAVQPAPGLGPLNSVWCGSASACIAVGSAQAAAWNGKTWAVQPGPADVGNLLQVSCSSASACTAVGFRYTSTGSLRSLTERWNGRTWAIQRNRPARGHVLLAGISCTSARSCTAVGSRVSAAGRKSLLAERWNGTSWAIERTPAPGAS